MGYYAEGSGTVVFKGPLSDAQFQELEAVLDGPYFFFESDIDAGVNHTDLCLWSSDKFREDSALKSLNELIPFGIRAGEIEFIGEDRSFWRYIWKQTKNGWEWVEQNGRVEYDE